MCLPNHVVGFLTIKFPHGLLGSQWALQSKWYHISFGCVLVPCLLRRPSVLYLPSVCCLCSIALIQQFRASVLVGIIMSKKYYYVNCHFEFGFAAKVVSHFLLRCIGSLFFKETQCLSAIMFKFMLNSSAVAARSSEARNPGRKDSFCMRPPSPQVQLIVLVIHMPPPSNCRTRNLISAAVFSGVLFCCMLIEFCVWYLQPQLVDLFKQ